MGRYWNFNILYYGAWKFTFEGKILYMNKLTPPNKLTPLHGKSWQAGEWIEKVSILTFLIKTFPLKQVEAFLLYHCDTMVES